MGIQVMSKKEVQAMHDKEILHNFVYFLEDYAYWIHRGGGNFAEYLSKEQQKRFAQLVDEARDARIQKGVKK